jgi:hypothetical protein
MVKAAVLLVVLLLASAGQLHAADKVYKWTDENGVVHYSATPPDESEAEAEPVEIRRGPPPPPATVGADIVPDEDGLRAAECTRSRGKMKVLLDNEVVELELLDGTRQRLTADEKALQIQQTQAEIDRWCKPAEE